MKKLNKFKILIISMLALIFVLPLAVILPTSSKEAEAAKANKANIYLATSSGATSATYKSNYTGDITLDLKLDNATGYGAWGLYFYIDFDTNAFTYVSIDNKVSAWTQTVTNLETGLYLTYSNDASLNDVMGTSLTIAQLKLKLKSNLQSNDYNITFRELDFTAANGGDFVQLDADSDPFVVTIEAPSNDAKLKTLTVGGTNVPISSFTKVNDTTYTYNIAQKFPYNSSKKIEVVATKNDNGANVTVAGNTNYNINGERKDITITVTAEDKTTVYTYKVSAEMDKAEDNNKVTSIKVNNYETTLKDGKYVCSYEFDYTVPSVQITVQTESNKATVSGTGSFNITKVGANEKTITVTAQNGSPATYVVQVIKKAGNADTGINSPVIKDNNNNEVEIEAEGTTFNARIMWKDVKTKTYTLYITALSSTSTVKIDKVETTSQELVFETTGNYSYEIEVIPQSLEDDSAKYTVNVTVYDVSSDTSLSKLEFLGEGGIKYIPSLSGSTSYSLPYPSTNTFFMITAEPSEEGATVEIQALTNNSDIPLRTISSGASIHLDEYTKRIRIVVTVSSGAPINYDVHLAPYSVSAEPESYISGSGDVKIAITEDEFRNPESQYIAKDIDYRDSSLSFYLDVPESIEVSVICGAAIEEQGSEQTFKALIASAESVTFGKTRYNINVEDIKPGNNTVVLKLTDTETNTSKLYILNILKPVAGVGGEKGLVAIIVLTVVAAILIAVLISVISVYSKKVNELRGKKASGKTEKKGTPFKEEEEEEKPEPKAQTKKAEEHTEEVKEEPKEEPIVETPKKSKSRRQVIIEEIEEDDQSIPKKTRKKAYIEEDDDQE